MKRKQIMKGDGRRGFTLVEIIVVLVILAILAAFTIPAMLGFVKEARGKAYLVEAREAYTAMQAALAEYGTQTPAPDADTYYISKVGDKLTLNASILSLQNRNNVTQNPTSNALLQKAWSLMSSDIKLNNDEWINMSVDPASNKVTQVNLYKGGYLITLDPTTNTTTINDYNN